MKKILPIFIIALIIIGGGAFYGGMVYGKNQIKNTGPGNLQDFRNLINGQGQNFTGRGGAAGANFTSGQILNKDNTTITLSLPNNGGSKIIFYSASTEINKMATGTPSDLIVGENVSVNGTANSDGSITAQTIQLSPASLPNPGGNPSNQKNTNSGQ
jgi:hypothetical protein